MTQLRALDNVLTDLSDLSPFNNNNEVTGMQEVDVMSYKNTCCVTK